MRKSKLLSLFFISSFSLLNANDTYLSKTKSDILNFSYDKAIEDSTKLKNDWINPITYQYIYSNTENYDTHKSYISISQPIFKSGGIYYAIKYAKSIQNETTIGIDLEKKELIKQIVNLLFQIKKIDITITKQQLFIKNANLDVQRKKEQVLNGILDTSFLDNSILDANKQKNTLIDLEYEKKTLINTLATLSDKSYKELPLPILSLENEDSFLQNNIYLKQAEDEINTSYWFKNMTIANYLPTVNFTADYLKYHDTDNNPSLSNDGESTFGFNITIPLDIKYSNAIESKKIEYLRNKSMLLDKKIEEKSLYQNVQTKISSIDKKISISKNDIKLYKSLVKQIKEQLDVGMKTQSDLETIENSSRIKLLEIESLSIEKQIELLEIYSRIES